MHDPQTLQLILTAVAAGALALQTIFMIVLAVIALKAIKTVREEMAEYRSEIIPLIDKIKPIVDKTREVVDKVAPRVDEITGQLTIISNSLREQTADIQAAANDIIDRTRRQAGRVDSMMTSVLNRVERAGEFVSGAVAKPMRQVSGLIASVKAAVDTLREQPQPTAPPPPPPAPRVVPTRFSSEGEPLPGSRATGNAAPLTPFRP
jgi:methyl-accepting chemotaxis protein